MLPQEIIRIKRDGGTFSTAQIDEFITGLTDGSISEAQAAAWAMAVFLNAMSEQECVDLTRAMTSSGTVLDWAALDLGGPVLDKHSTGGVGDNVSLMLAPMLAACGAFVPMISGRGLGHTGGTLDKLDAIPGFTTQPGNDLFRATVASVGCAIIGQTGDLAPADKRLYGIRDVTATVESVPLITASILSKKLAAGLDGLVMDVKTGSGAFAAHIDMARQLARSLVRVANGAGLECSALITDMNQPLASAAGNALEVANAVDFLTGEHRDQRLEQITLALGAEMLVLGGLAADRDRAVIRLTTALDDGTAAEKFAAMVAALGGPNDFVEHTGAHLPQAPLTSEVEPDMAGIVAQINTREVGLAVVELGGGRVRADAAIDPRVGLTGLAGLGQQVGPGQPLAVVHGRDDASAKRAAARLRAAYVIGEPPGDGAAVIERIGAGAP